MKNSRNLLLTILGLSFIGFADATFLAIKHYTGAPIPCSFLDGCDTVTSSIYSTVAGIPVALLGSLFYLTVFVLILFYLQEQKEWLVKTVWFLSLLAFIASLVFVYLQGFVIGSWCQYCLVSALTSTLIFVLTTVLARRVSTKSFAV